MDAWAYNGNDPCGQFYTECRKFNVYLTPIRPGDHILEVGCAEFDWLSLAAECWPETQFHGIDQRCKNPGFTQNDRVLRVKDDILSIPFPSYQYDAVVSISTIEHIGLGHYGDPIDPEGDIVTMSRLADMLKPGGWMYFDVPYDIGGYRQLGTKCRIYNDEAIRSRLWSPVWRRLWRAFAPANDVRKITPTPEAMVLKANNPHPYWYIGQVWQRR